ncbi:hypothetical protein [Candidatus Vidania fulgoroideorum]
MNDYLKIINNLIKKKRDFVEKKILNFKFSKKKYNIEYFKNLKITRIRNFLKNISYVSYFENMIKIKPFSKKNFKDIFEELKKNKNILIFNKKKYFLIKEKNISNREIENIIKDYINEEKINFNLIINNYKKKILGKIKINNLSVDVKIKFLNFIKKKKKEINIFLNNL